MELRYDLGKGVGTATSNTTVRLNSWHTVLVSRTGKSGQLVLNGGHPVSVVSPGNAVGLDVESDFFLGGVRRLTRVNPRAVGSDASALQDYSGCIDHFEVG